MVSWTSYRLKDTKQMLIESFSIDTLTADDEYFRHNRKNLPLTIQMQLSKKPKIFCCLFMAFLESTLNFKHFEKKPS